MTFWDYLDKNPAVWLPVAVALFYSFIAINGWIEYIWRDKEGADE
jgi:hypothetical protein